MSGPARTFISPTAFTKINKFGEWSEVTVDGKIPDYPSASTMSFSDPGQEDGSLEFYCEHGMIISIHLCWHGHDRAKARELAKRYALSFYGK